MMEIRSSLFYIDDESRVILNEIPEQQGSDYINASWINVITTIIIYDCEISDFYIL